MLTNPTDRKQHLGLDERAMDRCMTLLIGIDVGTTAVKAAVFTMDGQVVARHTTRYPTHRPARHAVEQRAGDWESAIEAALRHFAEVVEPGAVGGIGLTSQVNTHLFVDGNGIPLGPALVWQDVRAAEAAAELDSGLDAATRLAWWGAPMPIDASHALARMRWMRRHRPATWEATAYVLLPKDHCLRWLTGSLVSDALSNIGLTGPDLSYVAPLLDLVPGAAGRLPPLASPDSVAGQVRPELPFAGTQVAVGTMDAWTGMLGCGVVDDGDAMYLGGTSEILGIVSSTVEPTPGVLVMPRSLGVSLHVGPTQSGGASLEWCARLLGVEPAQAIALAAAFDRSRPCPLFLPHLDGERAPVWDAAARGVFIGLDASTDRPALAFSVLDGVACSARWLFDSLVQSAGLRPAALRVGGGGFASDVWNRRRADLLGLPLERVVANAPGTLGAAALAAIATGLYDSLPVALAALVRIDRIYEPDVTIRDRMDERMALFKDTWESTCGLSHRFVASSRQPD